MNELLPRRDAVLGLLASRARPLTSREIAARLDVKEGALPGFVRFLEGLAQEGALCSLDGERFSLIPSVEVAPGPRGDQEEYDGVLEMIPGGGGLLRAQNRPEDLRLSERSVGGALHGDRVLARAVRRGPLGPEGEVIRVLDRAPHRVAGSLKRRGSSAWIEPDDVRVRGPIVLRGEIHGRDGDAVVGKITRFPEYPDENPEGELIACLGPPGRVRIEEQKILLREGIDELSSTEAQIEAQHIPADPPAATQQGREDLTHLPLLGINAREDGPFDLAFHVEREGGGSSVLWIVAADVAQLAPPGSALDRDARARGAAILLPERQVPLLPPLLLSEPCALLPGRLRLGLGVRVHLDHNAEPADVRLVSALVRVKARIELAEASECLAQDHAEGEPEGLRSLGELAQKLERRREARGALDLETSDAQVILQEGEPTTILRTAVEPGERKALRILRELPLLAGEVVGRYLAARGLAAPFRWQASPDPARVKGLLLLCERAGVSVDEIGEAPEELARCLAKIRRHPWSGILQEALRRAIPEASYGVSHLPHFGLALSAFSSFTGASLRSADLMVQQIMTAVIEEEQRGGRRIQDAAEEQQLVRDVALAIQRERRASAVEQEVLALHRALLLRSLVGETLQGQVTGVRSDSVRVTVDEPFVEVEIRADALGREPYDLEERALRFHARKGNDSVGLGDRVAVTIGEVDVHRRLAFGWRHTADMADRAPLRHAPFHAAGKKRATDRRTNR